VDAFSVNPTGSTPETVLQVYGDVPPLAISVALYAVPCCPAGKTPEPLLMVRLSGATVRLSDCVALCDAGSLTLTPKLNVPDTTGFPEITPLEASKVKPEGNDPELTLQVYGVLPPVAANVAL
jgi:hypothetical protein